MEKVCLRARVKRETKCYKCYWLSNALIMWRLWVHFWRQEVLPWYYQFCYQTFARKSMTFSKKTLRFFQTALTFSKTALTFSKKSLTFGA